MWIINDPTIDEILESCDYYKEHPEELEKVLEEDEEAMKLVDKYLLGNGDNEDEPSIKSDENTL